jgi:N-acetylglucosaminyl-diphospho-decaprenol L-rhamnosyltransferase
MTEAPTAALAVVIVNYNTGDWLARCLASLARARDGLAVDVVVIDNASVDGSADIVDGSPSVRLIQNPENRYLSPAWNQGAAATDAPYLLFLNPDTEWFAGTLGDLLRVAHADPSAGIVGPMLRDPDGSVYASGRRFPGLLDGLGHAFVSLVRTDNRFTRRYRMDEWDRTTPRVVDWVSGACMLMPRAAFDAVGGFDERFPLYAEELDIATRLRDAGWHVLFTPEVEVLHAVGVSTGGDRRPHRLVVMHSTSLSRYYARHRAGGWRRVTLPMVWLALRVRAELAWAFGKVRRG